MSKAYKNINSISFCSNIAFGGGGGGRRKKKKKKSKTVYVGGHVGHVGRTVSQNDRAHTAHIVNNSRKRVADKKDKNKTPGQRWFSQFNSDIPGGHADRNIGKMQADALKEGWGNSSNGDKVRLIGTALKHTNIPGIAWTTAEMAADASDRK